ncbi:hypothetical protein CEV31_1057 [Brucella thiophenivorans]|uniref:Uncharacterized protein n=1 Tax=Brucella thiophenivorans TaxID=571255 RepID=A0A256G0Z8_9HYPH|nr:hypothetical protein CEV31_1057 [Brucella thiophenivorans]
MTEGHYLTLAQSIVSIAENFESDRTTIVASQSIQRSKDMLW